MDRLEYLQGSGFLEARPSEVQGPFGVGGGGGRWDGEMAGGRWDGWGVLVEQRFG